MDGIELLEEFNVRLVFNEIMPLRGCLWPNFVGGAAWVGSKVYVLG